MGTQWSLAALLLALGAAGVASSGRVLTLAGGAWMLAALLLAAFVASAGNVACDGFAIDQLARRQRGWGNAVQVGGSYVGAMLGGGGFLLAAQAVGWPQALLGAAAAMALFSLPMLAVLHSTNFAESKFQSFRYKGAELPKLDQPLPSIHYHKG